MDDRELIHRYGQQADQSAFEELVRRHGGWLYFSAQRQVKDEHLAEDVTQAVFLLMAKRAKSLGSYAYVSGWLFHALRYCARVTVRERQRREKYEREAAMVREKKTESTRWEEIAPELDAAVGKLGKADREAVLLRFYEQRPLVEVGRALGISEEAARKRVDRALEKLRGMLGKKGITGTSAGLSAVFVGHVVEQMPTGLVEKIVSSVGHGGGNTVAAGIAKGAMKMMALAKVKVAAVIMLGIGVVGGVATAQMRSGASPQAAAATRPVAKANAGTANDTVQVVNPPGVGQSAAEAIQVMLPDGTPASGATVYHSWPGSKSLELRNAPAYVGRGPSSRPSDGVVGADGMFKMPAPRPEVLVVMHPKGIVQLIPGDLGPSGKVVLEPWAEVRGQISPALRIGGRQKAVYFCARTRLDGLSVSSTMETLVDEQGRFAFDRIPPGPGIVCSAIDVTRGMTGMHLYDHGKVISPAPGQQISVPIGGDGVRVSGHVEPPGGSTWKLAESVGYVRLAPMLDPAKAPKFPKLPFDPAKAGEQQVKAWLAAWQKTPEGKAFEEANQAMTDAQALGYSSPIRDDGTFELKETPAGRYRMSIQVSEVYKGPGWGAGRGLAQLTQEVTVPATAVDGFVDLGKVVLK